MPFPTGSYLIDTRNLIRLDEPNSPTRAAVTRVLRELEAMGSSLHIAPQNLIEFWNVATRPIDRNGLGLTPHQALARVEMLKSRFATLSETPAIYPEWERLATHAQVSGKQVHDTRLVAFMVVHGITNLLTLNPNDFQRFVGIAGITIVQPTDA